MSIYSKTAAGWVEVAGGGSKAALSSWGRVVGEPEGAVTSTYYKNDDGSQWQYWEFNSAGDYEIDLGNGGLFWVLAVGGGGSGWSEANGNTEQGQPGLVREGLWEFGPGSHAVTVGKAGKWAVQTTGQYGDPSSIGDFTTQGKVGWGRSEMGRGGVEDNDTTGYKSLITGDELEYAPGQGGPARPGRGQRAADGIPGCVIIATRIDVEQLAPAPAELAPAPVLGAPVKVSGSADVVEYIVRQTDGTRKKIYMLPGDTTDNGGENVFEVALGAGTLNGIMVAGGGQGGNQGAGGAGGVIGTGAHVPVILPVQGPATYTFQVAGTHFNTDPYHTRPGMNTTIAVQGQTPFAVAVGGGDGVGLHTSAIGGGRGASGGGAGQWASGAALVEYWGQGSPGIPGQGHQGGPHQSGEYGGGGGYGGPGGSRGSGGEGFDLAAAFQLNKSDGPTAAFLAAVSADGIIAGGGAVGASGVAVGGGGTSTGTGGTGTHAQSYTGSGGGGQKADTTGNSKGGCGAVYIITDV